MDSVGRNERGQAAGKGASRRLVTLGGGDAGTGVDQRREIVRIRGRLGQYDVVLLRSPELKNAQFGFDPVNAVVRLGITSHLVFAAVGLFSARIRAVVQPVAIAVFQHGHVPEGEEAFPGMFPLEHHLGRSGPVQLQRRACHRVDEVAIDKQFAARADIDRLGRHRRCGRKQRQQQRSNSGSSRVGSLRIGIHITVCGEQGDGGGFRQRILPR